MATINAVAPAGVGSGPLQTAQAITQASVAVPAIAAALTVAHRAITPTLTVPPPLREEQKPGKLSPRLNARSSAAYETQVIAQEESGSGAEPIVNGQKSAALDAYQRAQAHINAIQIRPEALPPDDTLPQADPPPDKIPA